MSALRRLAQAAADALDGARTHAALGGATRVGRGTRVFGWPRVACDGELVIGRDVVLVSSPAAIDLLVAAGGSLIIGDGVLIESGAVVRAERRIIVGAGARIGAGCVVDDHDCGSEGISILDHAWLEDGAIVLGGARVAANAVVGRRANVEAAASRSSASLDEDGGYSLEVERRMRAVIERVVAGARGAERRTDLSQIKGWDSLAALRVLVALEKEFGVALPPELFAKNPTFESIAPAILRDSTRFEGAR